MCKIISTSSFVCNHLFHWTPLVNGSGISGANRILIFIYTRVWEGSECVFVNSSGSRWCIWILNHRNEPQGRAMCLLVELTAFYLLLFWINPALSADSSLSDHPCMSDDISGLFGRSLHYSLFTLLWCLSGEACMNFLAPAVLITANDTHVICVVISF